MFEFEIQRCTRRCAKTERELVPGEEIYSVLIPDGGQVIRLDYGLDAWTGPPDEAIGAWKSKIPEPNAKKVNWAPNDVMLDYFIRLESDPTKQDVRFVLALLLLRRRVLRMEDSPAASADQMVMHCGRNETEYRVAVVTPTAGRIHEIQEELAQLLFGDEN